ncbi:hypothetical protein KCU65_g466, partial [Aureobasidium melanogenum]
MLKLDALIPFGGMVESLEKALHSPVPIVSAAKHPDNEKKLLKLLPRQNAPQPGDRHVTDLATFINPMQRPRPSQFANLCLFRLWLRYQTHGYLPPYSAQPHTSTPVQCA